MKHAISELGLQSQKNTDLVYLCNLFFKFSDLRKYLVDWIFAFQSKTGALEGPEVDGFVKDMMELVQVSSRGCVDYPHHGLGLVSLMDSIVYLEESVGPKINAGEKKKLRM